MKRLIEWPQTQSRGPLEAKQTPMMNRARTIRTFRSLPVTLAALVLLLHALVAPAGARADCEDVQVPAGHKVAFHTYAAGVQIYRWNGTSWSFVAPDAALFADAGGNGVVGIHYGGPTWESVSGSKVRGALVASCTPDPDAIPWLRLRAVYNEGPGVFGRVTFIQRVNTVGGKAPTDSGDSEGEEARVPYTAEYIFYEAAE